MTSNTLAHALEASGILGAIRTYNIPNGPKVTLISYQDSGVDNNGDPAPGSKGHVAPIVKFNFTDGPERPRTSGKHHTISINMRWFDNNAEGETATFAATVTHFAPDEMRARIARTDAAAPWGRNLRYDIRIEEWDGTKAGK